MPLVDTPHGTYQLRQKALNYEEQLIANQSLITLNTSSKIKILEKTMQLHYHKAILTDTLGGRHAIAP